MVVAAGMGLGLGGARVPWRFVVAVSAILGHTFPVWLKFKGGKGVATSLGVFMAVAWQPTLSAFIFWMIMPLSITFATEKNERRER